MHALVQLSAVDDAQRFAHQRQGHRDVDILVQVHAQEIDVLQGQRNRVDLRVLDHRGDFLARAGSARLIQGQREHRVAASILVQRFQQQARVQRHGHGRRLAAVKDTGDFSGRAQPMRSALA